MLSMASFVFFHTVKWRTEMKIVQINTTFGKGSTGKICFGIGELLRKEGIDNCVLYSGAGIGNSFGKKYTSEKNGKINALKSRIFGNFGFNSINDTKSLIAKLDEFSPDIVHIHNIHSHNCNFEMLLSYLKEHSIKVVWTFHDCWCFTGYCTYFDVAHCEKWKDNCHDCPQKKFYSWFWDKSSELQKKKKYAFEGLDLTIITPSKWLAELVKESFLQDFPVKVIYNGIDQNIFRPMVNSAIPFPKKQEDKIVLGVSFGWEYRKGLDVFISLSERLPANYKIVLVGTDDKVDKGLPENIISIHRTHNQQELAEIYSAADVFVNPTREDNFPTVNIEALACGTPVVTFKTGGSPECIDETCGSVVDCDDIDALEKEIIRICETKPYSKDACLKRAGKFDMNERFMEYVELYKELL